MVILPLTKRTPTWQGKLARVGVLFDFITDVIMTGGAEGNRPPVRKQLDMTFSGCIMSFEIPLVGRRHTGFPLG